MERKIFVSELLRTLNKYKFSINTLRHIYGYPKHKIKLYFNPNCSNFFSKSELNKFCKFFELTSKRKEELFLLQEKCSNGVTYE